MTLPVKTLAQFTSDQVTAWANAIGLTPALTTGDALLALFEAVSAQLEFVQSQVQLVVALSRAQTSTGADLDSWMAQFGVTRLPATFAEGVVTFTKLSPATTAVLIPAATLTNGVYSGGVLVQTTGGAIQYQVIPDTTQPTYSPSQNAYVLAIGQTTLTASVQALVGGAAYNVSAGQLVQIASTLAGIDLVTNGSAINNGVDAESDAAFRARFPLYLASLAKATLAAILYAASSVQQGLSVTPLENTLPNGTTQQGAFTLIIDNGTGAPPSELLSLVYDAVYAVRAFTVQPNVIGPSVVNVPIGISIRLATGYTSGVVVPLVQSAIAAVVNGLADAATLYVSAVEQAALGVTGVLAVKPATTTINGVQADFVPTSFQTVRTSVGTVTVGLY